MAAAITPQGRVFTLAQLLYSTRSLSVWDALLVAACADAGVTTLYTEDLQHGETIEGVTVVNPFL
jgi:predicted nucleic acid-binding protein